MIGSSHAAAPNPHYYCQRCGRDLWARFRRLRNPNRAPTMYTTLSGERLCERCFFKEPIKRG